MEMVRKEEEGGGKENAKGKTKGEMGKTLKVMTLIVEERCYCMGR